jgi:hypothetical protein
MIALYIDNQQVDLRTGTEVAVTKQVATVFNLEQRQTDFTNRFTIPSTMRNVAIMEQLRLPGNTSTRPYKLADARLEVNGIPYAANMKAICTKSDGIGYEVNLVGVAFDFAAEAKKVPLRDVVNTFFNGGVHDLSISTWKALQSSLGFYTYPLIQQVRPFPGFPKTRLYIDTTYPAFFTRDLFAKLLEGYFDSIDTNIDDKPLFETDVTFAMATESEAWKEWERGTANLTAPINYVSFGGGGGNGFTWFPLATDKNDKAALGNTLVISPALFRYRAPANRLVTVSISYAFTGSFGTGVKLQLRTKPSSQGTPDPTDALIAETDNITSAITAQGEFTAFVRKDYDLYFSLQVVSNPTFNFTMTQFDLQIQPTKQGIFGDATMNPKLLLPNITQWDYFADQVKRFGLVWQQKPGNEIKIECFADIFEGAFGIEDWTRKAVAFTDNQYRYGDYGQRSFFEYSGDRSSGILDTTYNGWGFYDMDNDNYPAEKVIVQSIGLAVTQALDWLQAPEPNALRIGGYESQDNRFVLLQNVDSLSYGNLRQTDQFPVNYQLWKLDDGAFSGNTGEVQQPDEFVANVAIQELQSISFAFYGNILPSIARPEVLTADILLTEADFYALDFFKLKYFEQLQANYYLVKAENYIPGKPCKCTFLKVKYPE